jgi:hypothetical protein
MDDENLPFLSGEEKNEPLSIQETKHLVKKSGFKLSIHAFFIILYTTIFVIATQKRMPQTSLHRMIPVQPFMVEAYIVVYLAISNLKIRYVPAVYDDFEKSPFAGRPSPSLDQAWHSLLGKTTIRVSEEELRRSNQSSVAFDEGRGYMAWLGVYHELHCIVRL